MASQGGKYEVKKKDPLKPFYPVIGLFVLGIAIAVGWFSAPLIRDFVDNYPAGRSALASMADVNSDLDVPRMVITFMVVLLVVMVFSAVFAIFAPKKERLVTENSLKAERARIEMERKRTKARKRKMKSKMKHGTKSIDDI